MTAADPVGYRCRWAGADELNVAYHDREWGRPVRSESGLFEALTLEGAQAGLSWLTILRKREGYRTLFESFDAERVAAYSEQDVLRLLEDARIVRHRGKIEATINNARRILDLRASSGGFSRLVWEMVDHEPKINHWKSLAEIPSQTPESEALSKRLKQHGFRFVGPTTCYAFMQAAGLVNDHETRCFLHPGH